MINYEKLVEFWASEYIDNNNYQIEIQKLENNITITIKLEKQYMGKIIGKNGNIITSLRNLVNSISNKDNKKVKILVKDI